MYMYELKDIKCLTFPGGELHPTLENQLTVSGLFARINNSEDLMKLLLVTNAYKKMNNDKAFDLYLPYIPYARQDRVANVGESLAIEVFADLINAQNYPSVHVLDPHSDISTALIKRVVVSDSTEFAKAVCRYSPDILSEEYVYVAPDAGCLKKVYKIAKATGYGGEVVFCEKQRDTKTGNITGTKVYCDNIEGRNFIMWDDICDGGRTFIEIAKVLKAEGANKVILATTHGIYSKGVEVLFDYIDEVYCTDSFKVMNESMPFRQFSALEIMFDYDLEDMKQYARKAV